MSFMEEKREQICSRRIGEQRIATEDNAVWRSKGRVPVGESVSRRKEREQAAI